MHIQEECGPKSREAEVAEKHQPGEILPECHDCKPHCKVQHLLPGVTCQLSDLEVEQLFYIVTNLPPKISVRDLDVTKKAELWLGIGRGNALSGFGPGHRW